MSRDSVAIAVHGGAGEVPPEERAPRRLGVERAATAAWAILERGGPAFEAAIAAVVVLEDDPLFNAGCGSVLTEEGEIEMDASLMDGDGLRAGAVAAVRGVANPILAARGVIEEGREVFLVGAPVVALARRRGLRLAQPGGLETDESRRRWLQRQSASGETVGAVARDAEGHVAAATSTGGVAGKRCGRVGDSAVIGAGTYADDECGAASATGPGEAIIRLGLARVALDLLRSGLAPEDAARESLARLAVRVGATAGIIVVGRDGRAGVAHTTEAMPAAWRGAGMGLMRSA